MKLSHIAAMVILGTSSFSALAQQRGVVELGHEAVPSMVSLPRSANGELTLQPCATCKVLSLRVNEATRYLIGKEQVTLAEMTKYLSAHPMIPLVVVQPRNELVLSRLVASTIGAK
jgi:hypothetical protein